jgi:hypothetical protein
VIWRALVGRFRSRAALEAENLVLRQQINVLRRTAPRRHSFGPIDCLIFVGLYQFFPNVRDALAIVQPDTVIRWHRAGFRAYWRRKSRARGGRPTVSAQIRRLIYDMSLANPLWGAPRIHGELLKLGIDIGQIKARKRGLEFRLGNRSAQAQSLGAFAGPAAGWFAPARIIVISAQVVVIAERCLGVAPCRDRRHHGLTPSPPNLIGQILGQAGWWIRWRLAVGVAGGLR